jgi:hypothetical protein
MPLFRITKGSRYIQRAVDLTNKAIEAIKLTAFDYTIQRIVEFENCQVHVLELVANGSCQDIALALNRVSFGPHRLSRKRILSEAGVQQVFFRFNGLLPSDPAALLILDAKLHNETKDFPRAILDLGTSLEIHVEVLLDLCSDSFPRLAQIETENASIRKFYDSILREATGQSLHERPELFVKLEYIRSLRNSITHK